MQQELLEKREDTNLCSGEAFEDWIKNGYRDGATNSTHHHLMAPGKAPKSESCELRDVLVLQPEREAA